MEMQRERYVNDLQLILTGEVQANQSYSFHLAPGQSGSHILELSYEKVQSNMSVSGLLWFADIIHLLPLLGLELNFYC